MQGELLISVIVPCYNQEIFLSEALNSICSQTYQNWECLIIDDGSTDGTEKVSEKYCNKDDRFRYYKKENEGLSSSRNFGLTKAKGQYIQFLDADDFLDQDKFKFSVWLFANKKVNAVICNFKMFEENKKKTSEPYCKLRQDLFTFEKVLYCWDENFTIPIHCSLFESTFFKSFRFSESLLAKEDWIMWIHFFKTQHEAFYLDKTLAYYRRHNTSMTMSKDISNDHLAALQSLKGILSLDQYETLLFRFITRYYNRSIFFKRKPLKIEQSNFFFLYSFVKTLERKFKK